MKKITFVLAALMAFVTAKADEGMWTLYNLPQAVYQQMQAEGFKLPYADIYQSKDAVKNAVVNFSGYCSGVVVSPNGLVFTNHHCGFEAIRRHSTVEHDYMLNGFYAKTYEEELPQRRPVGGGVHRDEPGHAHRRRRCEESVDEGGALARRGRRRQGEQRRLDEDDPREDEKGQARGRIAGNAVHSLPRPKGKPGRRGRTALSPHSLTHDGRSLLLPVSRLAFFRARGL